MVTSLQRICGGSEDTAPDPGLYLQLSDAGTCLLARTTSWHRMRGQVRRW